MPEPGCGARHRAISAECHFETVNMLRQGRHFDDDLVALRLTCFPPFMLTKIPYPQFHCARFCSCAQWRENAHSRKKSKGDSPKGNFFISFTRVNADRNFNFSWAGWAYKETIFTSAQIRASRSRPFSLPSTPKPASPERPETRSQRPGGKPCY